jgi:hypothetical protein
MEAFISFIHKLKSEENTALIESIENGYKIIFESEDEEELEEMLRWENLSPKQKDFEIALKHNKKPAKEPVEKVSRKPAHKHPEEWKKAVEMAKTKYSPKTKMMWMQAEIIYQKLIRNK